MALERAARGKPGPAWAFTEIRYLPGEDQQDVPGVAVGSQILLPADGGTYELYLLFPMTEEQDTLSLLRTSLIRPARCS